MSTQAFFHYLEHSAVGTQIGKLDLLFGAAAQLIHIAGFLLILTPILLVNLRLLGLGLTSRSARQLAKETNQYIAYGFVLLLISGLFILIPSASLYYPNTAFWLKFGLLLGALLIQFTLYSKATASDTPHRVLSVSTAILSLFLWFAVAFAGRAIGFF